MFVLDRGSPVFAKGFKGPEEQSWFQTFIYKVIRTAVLESQLQEQIVITNIQQSKNITVVL